jgi:hypothetical protein
MRNHTPHAAADHGFASDADGSKLLSHPLVVIQKRRGYMDEVEVFRQFERSFVILRDKGDRFV